MFLACLDPKVSFIFRRSSPTVQKMNNCEDISGSLIESQKIHLNYNFQSAFCKEIQNSFTGTTSGR